MSESDYVDTAIEAEAAWKHAEEHHWADETNNETRQREHDYRTL